MSEAVELARLWAQLSRRVVSDPGHQPGCRRVLDHDRDGFALSKRERFGHFALSAVARTIRQKRKVARRDDDQPDVIDHGDEGEHRRHDRKGDQGRADADRPEQPGLWREASDQIDQLDAISGVGRPGSPPLPARCPVSGRRPPPPDAGSSGGGTQARAELSHGQV